MEKVIKTRIKHLGMTAAEWTSQNPVLLLNELGLETDTKKFKFGDGTSNWNDLDYAGVDSSQIQSLIDASEDNFYSVEATAEQDDLVALGTVTTEPKKGDIGVVKRTIASDKTSYTAYIYNGSTWGAADGNYNAENVYFGKDLTITANIGVQTVGSSGSKTLATTGKNVKEVFDMIMASEKNPVTTPPSVTVACSQMKNYEVGTKVTPQWSVTLNPGSYTYGPATGVTATSYEVEDSDGNSSTESSGSFPQITVADGENYSISATVGHTEGAIPKTNLNNDYAAGKIAQGSKSGSKGSITGHRKTFYGTTTDKSATTNSAVIRGLAGKSNGALVNGSTFDVSIPLGALRVIIAYPATLRDITSIKDSNGLNAEIKPSFTLSTVSVEGAEGYTGINYKVYTMDYANPNDKVNAYKVTI